MRFDLTVLGSNSAIPAYDRYPTAQVLNVTQQPYLIDCGEATQIQLNRYNIRKSKIRHIFISHLHGDHFFGLIGLITSFQLLGRNAPLTVYGPPKLKDIIEIQLEDGLNSLDYDLQFIPLQDSKSELIFKNENMTVHTIPLKHRIPCTGFLFREKERKRKIIKEKIKEYNIPVDQIKNIKEGEDFKLQSGKVISNDELTIHPHPVRAYAYCSDTAYNEDILNIIEGVDLLYHESTFLKKEQDRAKKTFHSTTEDAAQLAKKAGAGKLLLGHYSARYRNLDKFLEEAREIFPNTELAKEGETYNINNDTAPD